MGKPFTRSVAEFPKLLSLWSPNNVVYPYEVPRKYQALWRCSAGHEFSATGQTVLKSKGEGCAACAGRAVNPGVSDLATVVPDAVDIWDHEVNPLSPSQVAATSSRKYWWRCSLGHPWLASPDKISRGQRCPYCSNRLLLPGFNDLSTVFPSIGEIWSPGNNLSPSQSLAYSDKRVKLLCPVNGTEYLESPRRFMRLGAPCLCASCYRPHSRSAFECSVVESLGALLPSYSPNLGNRSLIPPYELDIYYPELNLAIECNGSYWHSEAMVKKNHKVDPREYHAMKRERCGDKGVKLLFIWEDDWDERREEVLTALEETIGGSPPVHPLFTILEKK